MNDYRNNFESELLEAPTAVMRQYLAHFEGDAHRFVGKLTESANVWEQYEVAAVKHEKNKPELEWSAAYFLNAANATLISTRLFLSGYIVPSGNQARHALESMAFGVLLCFPRTCVFQEWKKGHAIEYKALEQLAKNAKHCGVNKRSAEALKKQTKWFDHYSHPSRPALAAIWKPGQQGGWNLGALFVDELLPQYRKEMTNRISLAQLLGHTIAGTHAALIEQKLI
jgi:hypothetical protein